MKRCFCSEKRNFPPPKKASKHLKKAIKYNLVCPECEISANELFDRLQDVVPSSLARPLSSGITLYSTMKPEQCVQSILSKAGVLLDDF